MSKLDEASFGPSGREYTLKVDTILQTLDEEDRAVLHRMLADRTRSHENVARGLAKADIVVAAGTIRKYRIKVLGWLD